MVRRKAFSSNCREKEKDLNFTRLCEKRKRTKRSSLHCGKGKKGMKEGRSEGGKQRRTNTQEKGSTQELKP
jgi:hypothetical protein